MYSPSPVGVLMKYFCMKNSRIIKSNHSFVSPPASFPISSLNSTSNSLNQQSSVRFERLCMESLNRFSRFINKFTGGCGFFGFLLLRLEMKSFSGSIEGDRETV